MTHPCERKWKIEHREQIREQQQPYMKEYRKTHRLTHRLIALMLIGDSCLFCDSTKNVEFHEIYGRKHSWDTYYLEHPTDFIPLCKRHHKRIHKNL